MSFIEQQLASTTIVAFFGDANPLLPPWRRWSSILSLTYLATIWHEDEDVSTKALEAPTMLWRGVEWLMRYAQHLLVNIAILEKIVQHPDLRKGLCTYPTLVCEDCKASTPIISSYAG